DRAHRRPARRGARRRDRVRRRLGVCALPAAVSLQARQLVPLQVVDRARRPGLLDRLLGVRWLLAGAASADDGARSGTYPKLTLGSGATTAISIEIARSVE